MFGVESEIFWHVTDYCNQECSYCPPRYRGGLVTRSTEEYIAVIEKIQANKYLFADKIKWSLSGGEALALDDIGRILRTMKSKESFIKIETSGGNSWFDYMAIQEYIDQITLTYHHWQNSSVVNYIIDFCQTNDKIIKIKVPYYPGKVKEQMAIIEDLNNQGIYTGGMALHVDARHGNALINGYSAVEINLMNGLSEDWAPPPAPPPVPIDPNAPDPNWKDPNIPPSPTEKQSLGRECYAGMDYMYISHKGYANGSDCGGRALGNVFDAEWQPVSTSFDCPMFWCHSSNDKKKIRIINK